MQEKHLLSRSLPLHFCLQANRCPKCVLRWLARFGAGSKKRGWVHNAWLPLEELSVFKCILQRQHWHYWLCFITIKKFRRGDSTSNKMANRWEPKWGASETDEAGEREMGETMKPMRIARLQTGCTKPNRWTQWRPHTCSQKKFWTQTKPLAY